MPGPSRIKLPGCQLANSGRTLGRDQRCCHRVVLCDKIRGREYTTLLPCHVERVNRAHELDQYDRWTPSIAAGSAIMVRTVCRNYRRMQFRRVALGNRIVLLHIASMTRVIGYYRHYSTPYILFIASAAVADSVGQSLHFPPSVDRPVTIWLTLKSHPATSSSCYYTITGYIINCIEED